MISLFRMTDSVLVPMTASVSFMGSAIITTAGAMTMCALLASMCEVLTNGMSGDVLRIGSRHHAMTLIFSTFTFLVLNREVSSDAL